MVAQVHAFSPKGHQINVDSRFRQCDCERTRIALTTATDLSEAGYSEIGYCWRYNRDSHLRATLDHPKDFERCDLVRGRWVLMPGNARSRNGLDDGPR